MYMYVCDWGDSEILDSLKLGELRFRSKTKAGPLEAEQLSRLGFNISFLRAYKVMTGRIQKTRIYDI